MTSGGALTGDLVPAIAAARAGGFGLPLRGLPVDRRRAGAPRAPRQPTRRCAPTCSGAAPSATGTGSPLVAATWLLETHAWHVAAVALGAAMLAARRPPLDRLLVRDGAEGWVEALAPPSAAGGAAASGRVGGRPGGAPGAARRRARSAPRAATAVALGRRPARAGGTLVRRGVRRPRARVAARRRGARGPDGDARAGRLHAARRRLVPAPHRLLPELPLPGRGDVRRLRARVAANLRLMARRDASDLYGDEHVRSYLETDGEYGHDWRGARPSCSRRPDVAPASRGPPR